MPRDANMANMTGHDAEVSETALVPADDTSTVDTSTRSYSTAVDFDPEDTMIPRVRLAQALTPEVINGQANAGQWVLIGGEPVDTLVVVPLSFGKSREYRIRDEQDIRCSSSDAKVGHGEYGVGSRENPDGLCDENHCPMAKWIENTKTGKNQKPLCATIFSYVVWDVSHQALATIDFKSTAIATGKLLNTMVRSAGGFGKFAVQLGATQQKTPKGTYYVPTIAMKKVEPEVLETAQLILGGN